ncbi:helix-turn-helix domain-containing protein [Celerinatantimonas sp. MCCC 1A17872]|uniref:helix-turn-helix domain-containing protein n=1 Tax=Celerinatantimonas sp. MCCC 1A17872 TaxID=3177514 RepID=UPI0038CC1D80
MSTTIDLLEDLKSERDLVSDYKVAKYLDVTQQTVSKWRNGASMSADMAFRIAEDLGLDIDAVYLSLLIDKAKSDKEKDVLKRLSA